MFNKKRSLLIFSILSSLIFIFPIISAATFTQGDVVYINWFNNGDYYDGSQYNYRVGDLTVYLTNPNGQNVGTWTHQGFVDTGGYSSMYPSGTDTYALPNNAVVGTYTITYENSEGPGPFGQSYGAYESTSHSTQFNVIAKTNPPGNNPGDACGTGNTCNNGLTCQDNICKKLNVAEGGSCDVNRLCSSGLQCTNGVCTSPVVQDNEAVGVTDGVDSSGYVSGWARDPDWQSSGQYIDIRIEIDGQYAGTTPANRPSEPAVGGSGNHRFSFAIPQAYYDGKNHEVWAYAIGKLSSGQLSNSNPQLGSPSYQSRIFNFPKPQQVCSSITYSQWSECINGQQTREITSSSPSGCTPTGAITTQSCQAQTNQTHFACVSQKCVSVNGTGQDSCSIDSNCLSGLGGVCNNNIGCQNGLTCSSDSLCVQGSPKITDAYWTNMIGDGIASSDKEDTVKLVVSGTSLSGQQVTFEVKKKKLLFDEEIDAKTVTASSGNIATTTVKIDEEGTYYFKASVSGSNKNSGELEVSNYAINSPPVSLISSPVGGAIYFEGNPVSFVHNSYDIDDEIVSEKWVFGDGSTGEGRTTSHSYSSKGQKNVYLEVKDSRNARAVSKVGIIIADSSGYSVFSAIEKPMNDAVIVSSSLVIDYSGKQSYVIKTSSTGSPCSVSVECIQGQCPVRTRASPSCAQNQSELIDVVGSTKGYTDMHFNWSFKDGKYYLSQDTGNGRSSGTKGFADSGNKNITLQIKYTYGGQTYSSVSSIEFLLLSQRQCSSDGATWYEVKNEKIVGSIDTLSTISCAGLDKQAGTNDDCCPQGFYCSTDGTVGCKVDSESQGLGCGSYTSQTACNSDSSNRVRNDVLWESRNCGRTIDGANVLCACVWDDSKDICELESSDRPDDNPIWGSLSTCRYTTETAECVDGYQNVKIFANSLAGNNPLCVDSTEVLPCGKPVVALPFFTAPQAISVVVLIFIIYYLITRKPTNKRVKKKRN